MFVIRERLYAHPVLHTILFENYVSNGKKKFVFHIVFL